MAHSKSAANIIHLCDDFVVMEKPFDLKINSNDPEETTCETLLRARGILAQTCGKRLTHSYHFIHRLDFATSGVLCVGLTKFAASQAEQAFSRRIVQKQYLALLRGHVHLPYIAETVSGVTLHHNADCSYIYISVDMLRDYETDFPFCFKIHDADTTAPQSTASNEKPINSISKMILLEYGEYEGRSASKVLFIPKTGRSHQLRVHSKHIGHPIVGDYTYSNRVDTTPYRMMLHSYKLMIPTQPFLSIQMKSEDPFISSNDKHWIPEKVLCSAEIAEKMLSEP